RFASDGTPVNSEFQVNSYTTSEQNAPDVADDGAGGFVVVWQSVRQDDPTTNTFGIFGQRFNSDGSRAGSEFQVNTYTTGQQFHPAVGYDGGSGFAVAWISNNQDGGGTGIFGQHFASDGSRQGTEFQVNSYTTAGPGGSQYAPSVGWDGSGGFVVAWHSYGQD